MTLKFNKIMAAIFAAIFVVSAALGIYFLMPNSTAFADEAIEENTFSHTTGDSHTDWTELSQSGTDEGENFTGGALGDSSSDDMVYYYLAEDITLTTNITISGYVTLCLNGKVLTGNGSGSVITVNSNANFTLCDCQYGVVSEDNAHNYYVNSDGLYVFSEDCVADCENEDHEGHGTIYGGVITGGSATNGGGVSVSSDAAFVMESGTIAGNYASNDGGGVYIRYSPFTMNGGTISGNYGRYGGGVMANYSGADFEMNGGTISDNTAEEGDGVRAYNSATFTMNGGYIDGSFSRNGTTITIYGGALSQEAYDSILDSATNEPQYIAEGSEAVSTGDETWTYVVVPEGTSAVTTDPTCTKEGYTGYTYKIDSVEYIIKVNIVPANGHSFTEYVSDNNATCTEDGTKTATCDNDCGATDIITDEDNPATGHSSGEAVTEKEVAATCTTGGSYDEVVYCTVCETELSRETKTTAATGHTWSEWEMVTEATAKADGEQQRTCSVCGEVETQAIPATGGLSGGAIAGIVIGCVVVAGAAVGLAIFLIRRRKNA